MSRPISVLLVDDHPIVREGYRRLLEESGKARVLREAATVVEAYQQFCRLTPDVVVMDLALPGVSGIAACPADAGDVLSGSSTGGCAPHCPRAQSL